MNIRWIDRLVPKVRTLPFILLALAAAGCQPAAPDAVAVRPPAYWPTQGWQSVAPETQGFNSAKLAEGLQAMRADGTPVHSLLVIRDGYLLLDTNFYPYDASTYHDLASVTKSFMTTLIGIAADQGLLDFDAPLVSFFPDRTSPISMRASRPSPSDI